MRSRVLAIAIAAFALASCNRESKKTIAVIPKGTAHLFWVSCQAGALAAGKDLNVDIQWNGPAQETEYDRQIQIVDSMVARHVDGIAIAASDRQSLVPPLDRAMKAGIPVSVFDSGIDGDNYLTFVATNNYEAGQLAARTLAGLVGGKGDIAVLAHVPGSRSTMDREKGFTDTIEKEFPNVKIVANQFGMSDRAKARAAAENMLTAHPNLAGFFASAEPSSVGASLALKARDMAGKTKYVAFDSSDTLIQDLRDGTMSAMVAQDPFQMSYQAVKAIVDKWNGKTPDKRIDLHARVIRKEQLDQPEVQQLLKPDISKYVK